MDVLAPDFTEKYRQTERERGRKSLFYYNRQIVGWHWLGELQLDLCNFLEGRGPKYRPWNVALVCAFRGGVKSFCTSMGYPSWRGIHHRGDERFRVRLIENSSENAFRNHFDKLSQRFRLGAQADYLQWMYREELDNFRGWNSDEILFGNSSITYMGIDSRFEGFHGDLIIGDDLEGADADKTDSRNEDSYAAFTKMFPLLNVPEQGQILVVGTPHGRNPLVHRIRDEETERREKGRRYVEIFWAPKVKPDGTQNGPPFFNDDQLAFYRNLPNWPDQYQLERRGSTSDIFNEQAINDYAFEWSDPSKTGIIYPAFHFDPNKVGTDGFVVPERKKEFIKVEHLRTYMHVDPTYKLQREMSQKNQGRRESKGAIVVVGVAPDRHVFPLECWHEDCDVTMLLQAIRRLARKWNVFKITFESTGSQVWLKDLMKSMEAQERAGMPGRLRSVANRMEAGSKTTESKEWMWREVLSPWVNTGIVHLHRLEHEALIRQMLRLWDEKQPVDLIDALAQGPQVWQPPADARFMEQPGFRARQEFVQMVQSQLTNPGMRFSGSMRGIRREERVN
jgi:hypothetical protein